MHCETYSHSRTIPENSFPFSPIPILAKSLSNQNRVKPDSVCNAGLEKFSFFKEKVLGF